MKHQSTYNRLRRIEGQIRGIEEMLTKERSDEEIFIQLSAVRSAVSSTLADFISSLLAKNEAQKITLTNEQVRLILKSIK